ncbi:MAG: acyl-ACP--UDP-N-acetylglucosamine O-acyltransferase [Candidatus Marinimicrobia bacterium]|nr:acyl-ACP--UDP-N-acetylglucosamine O-acyltransferase [Candidatus Neomarinimicrobiota bacterium]MDP6852482.1 acyl-ACP--UDP-N-acetylglucosamine O-acyltransferase [Candidatus Neomarinimicrobiota bacterium]MDP6936570.1 acyl-ACP--UDP-N-acetylglucosamine O-acyltransferase [Candidatus Neomarinimicrobiota bacterium]
MHQWLTGRIEISDLVSNYAVIDPGAKLGKEVSVGPFAIIEGDVVIGDGTHIHANAQIKQFSRIGKNSKIFAGSIIGEIPQDLKYSGEDTELIIGDNTTVREFCTLNRGTSDSGKTVIGSNCLLMAYVHIAHDCIVGNNTILANGVQLGGHVEIGNHVTIGGMTPVHQFCKVGDYAFVGGGYRIVQDVPPFIMAMGEPLRFSGLNSVGLRRKNFSAETRTALKRAYKLIYQSDLNRSQAVEKIESDLNSMPEMKTVLSFIELSSRGLI